MKNQVLSIKQMQELKELGIDTSKASMCWLETFYTDRTKKFEPEVCNENQRFDEWCLPAFTLQDILEMLPDIIVNHEVYIPVIQKNFCKYVHNDNSILHLEVANNTIEAAFNMLKWCKQNNYI